MNRNKILITLLIVFGAINLFFDLMFALGLAALGMFSGGSLSGGELVLIPLILITLTVILPAVLIVVALRQPKDAKGKRRLLLIPAFLLLSLPLLGFAGLRISQRAATYRYETLKPPEDRG